MTEPSKEEAATAAVRERSWTEVRWRQARNPPPPVLRAVLANIVVAGVGGVVLLVCDRFGLGDIAVLTAVYVGLVLVLGSLFTYLWVELPTGAAGTRRRSPWAALLGFFAALPICYLALVLVFQVVRPLLG
jgi:hypothetical protein